MEKNLFPPLEWFDYIVCVRDHLIRPINTTPLKDYQLRNRGDIFVMNNGPLESYKYLDSKPVYMLSTKHGSSLSTTSRRNRITNEIIRKPNVVTNYNKYMGGVFVTF
jgi:hypothetical protein